jgi:ABC-type glycerol-3-phosphate transport system permease component
MGLVLADLTLTIPFSLYVLIDFVKAIPLEFEESAEIDGAGRFKTFLLIVLPLMRPGIIAVGIYSFITAWNEYLYALVFIASENLKVLPVGVAMFADRLYAEWGLIMSAAVFITIPVAILFMFVQKQLIVGLAAGGVKE